jgi:hypothetical protein
MARKPTLPPPGWVSTMTSWTKTLSLLRIGGMARCCKEVSRVRPYVSRRPSMRPGWFRVNLKCKEGKGGSGV